MFQCVIIYITWWIQQHNLLCDILIVDCSSLGRTSFPTWHHTTWFQTPFLFIAHLHFHVIHYSQIHSTQNTSLTVWLLSQLAKCHGHGWYMWGKLFMIKTFVMIWDLYLTTLQLCSECFSEAVWHEFRQLGEQLQRKTVNKQLTRPHDLGIGLSPHEPHRDPQHNSRSSHQ